MKRTNEILETKMELHDGTTGYNEVTWCSVDTEVVGRKVCFSCKNIQRQYKIHILVMAFSLQNGEKEQDINESIYKWVLTLLIKTLFTLKGIFKIWTKHMILILETLWKESSSVTAYTM